jgi:hypothetical protein
MSSEESGCHSYYSFSGSASNIVHTRTYMASRDEKDYQAFLDCLSVQLGDRIAREELEKPEPNYTAMYAGFRQGKIAEADIPG